MIALPPPRPSVARRLLAPAATPGFSPEAGIVESLVLQASDHWLESVAIRGRYLAALVDLDVAWHEAAEAGSENQDAPAPDCASWRAARDFLNRMPSDWPMPAVSIDADGEVAFDWDFGWRQGLALSVGPNGRLHFAWFNGSRTVRGTDWLGGYGIPATVAAAFISQRG